MKRIKQWPTGEGETRQSTAKLAPTQILLPGLNKVHGEPVFSFGIAAETQLY